MKRLIYITLCIVIYCKAADQDDPYARWHQVIAPLQPIEKRENLYLGYIRLAAIPNLNTPTLKRLHLYGNLLTALPNLDLTALEALDVSRNQLTILPNLAALTALEWLYVGHNLLTTLPPLSALSALKELDLSHNQLELNSLCPHIQAIKQLTHLRILTLDENPISPSEVEWLRKELGRPDLYISATDVGPHHKILGLAVGARIKKSKQPNKKE